VSAGQGTGTVGNSSLSDLLVLNPNATNLLHAGQKSYFLDALGNPEADFNVTETITTGGGDGNGTDTGFGYLYPQVGVASEEENQRRVWQCPKPCPRPALRRLSTNYFYLCLLQLDISVMRRTWACLRRK
jgi:hypothetical protein